MSDNYRPVQFAARQTAATCFLALLALSGMLALGQTDSSDPGREICTKNLLAINQALQAYRADHKDVPNWLSDLVPKYLSDPNALICPNTKETGQIINYGIVDPRTPTSYIYEFSDAPIPKDFSGGAKRTMREWKRRQMELVGPRIPIVRCHHHKQVLNLSFDGKVYPSGGAWESELKDGINVADLMPNRIFAVTNSEPAKKSQTAALDIPGRDPKIKPNLIDLSSYYNAALTEGWHRQGTADTSPVNDLAWLPRGAQKFAGVDFDVRGIIQLSSRRLSTPRFPKSVRGIKIGRKTPLLHFLQGTGWAAAEGTPIGSFVFNYANGEKRHFTVVYGTHVIDWVTYGQPADKQVSVLAWSGKSPVTEQQGMELRLYKTQWRNPLPDETIETLDYLSSMADPAPFLIAITAE